MSHRRPSEDDKRKASHSPKKGYPVARPINPPAGHQRPMPAAAPKGIPVARPARRDNDLAFSVDDPPLKPRRRRGLFTPLSQVGLVLIVLLIGIGTVVFAFNYRKGRKAKLPHADAVAKVDADKKTDSGEKKPEEKKPEEKKPATEEKKPEEKKPAAEEKKPTEKKPEEKKPEEKKPAMEEKKPTEKKPEEKKPAEKKPEEKKPEEKKPPEKKPEEKKPDPGKPVGDPAFASVIFEKDVMPIFKAKCNFCHGDKPKPKGGLDTRTIEAMIKGGKGGTSLVRGNLDKSPIWQQIADDTMPPSEKLTNQEKDVIRKWILGGARDAAMAAAK